MEVGIESSGTPDIRDLIVAHLRGMHASSPAESVHALDGAALDAPDITLWAARIDGRLAGIGALKRLDDRRGEIKSMRVDDEFLGRGVGRAVLARLIEDARTRGMTSLWLETGRSEEFAPALGLYASAGFVECGPFADYVDDPFSAFFTLEL